MSHRCVFGRLVELGPGLALAVGRARIVGWRATRAATPWSRAREPLC